MGYHALGSLGMWDRMVHAIIFYESTDVRMYVYVVFLLNHRLVGIKVSSSSEYNVNNGLSCIGQFRNVGQNGYVIIFDESTDVRMYVYVVFLNQTTPMVRKTLFWGSGWRKGETTSF